jgi:hypothetical protein
MSAPATQDRWPLVAISVDDPDFGLDLSMNRLQPQIRDHHRPIQVHFAFICVSLTVYQEEWWRREIRIDSPVAFARVVGFDDGNEVSRGSDVRGIVWRRRRGSSEAGWASGGRPVRGH